MPSLENDQLLLITNILITTRNPPSVVNIIIQGLTSYYNGKDTIDTSRFDGRYLKIAQHQNTIRLDNCARGRISKTFQREEALHYKNVIRSTFQYHGRLS